MPSSKQIRRWRKYLANERAEARTYRTLAENATGEQRDILCAVAEAETRHERYWEAVSYTHLTLPTNREV